MTNASRPLSFFLLVAVLIASLFAPLSAARQREHLTPEEIELVRDAQQLDLRTAVFIKAAERRLLALAEPTSRQLEKDREQWGEVKGTRRQLLDDMFKILDEAVLNIDDTHTRDPKSSLLAKSLSKLAGAATKLLPQLTPLRDSARELGEREALEEVIEKTAEIIEAAKRHNVEDQPEKAKSGKKGAKEN